MSGVQAGSSSEYGYCDHAPAEDEPPAPTTAYAVGKLAATLYGQSVARAADRHVCTLRLYSVYGPWEEPDRLIPTLVAHATRGALPPLVDPGTARDFVHVDDVCEAFVRAAERTGLPRGTVLNVGSGRQTTIAEVVAVARDAFGVAAAPRWGTMPARVWDTAVWVSDPSAARRALGWTAERALADGLRDVAEWLGGLPPELARRYAR